LSTSTPVWATAVSSTVTRLPGQPAERASRPGSTLTRWAVTRPDTEATVYFCGLEATQNAAKHAGAGAILTVRVRAGTGTLSFEVSDDGNGFGPGQRGPAPDSST
jgi:signal transduction histidine kinase